MGREVQASWEKREGANVLLTLWGKDCSTAGADRNRPGITQNNPGKEKKQWRTRTLYSCPQSPLPVTQHWSYDLSVPLTGPPKKNISHLFIYWLQVQIVSSWIEIGWTQAQMATHGPCGASCPSDGVFRRRVLFFTLSVCCIVDPWFWPSDTNADSCLCQNYDAGWHWEEGRKEKKTCFSVQVHGESSQFVWELKCLPCSKETDRSSGQKLKCDV